MVVEIVEIVVERWAKVGEARRKRRSKGRRCRRKRATVVRGRMRSVEID